MVYYIVFGDTVYYDNLKLSIQSLIKLGKFAGEILVFSDKKLDFPKVHNVVLDLPSFKDWFELRFRCYHYFDFNRFQNIIFLDGDVLVVRPLENLFSGHDVVCFCQADHYIDTGLLNAAFFDSKMFWQNWYKNPINAGQIIFNGQTFEQTLRIWSQNHDNLAHKKFISLDLKIKKTWSDQCSFNYILRKNLVTYKALKRALKLPIVPWHHFFYKDYFLVHYAAFPPTLANKYMFNNLQKLMARIAN